MNKELLERIQKDHRFFCKQCPDGSWDVWFDATGRFEFHSECGIPIEDNKILCGIFRDTKEFSEIINRVASGGKR